MDKTKLVTLEHLEYAINELRRLINQKASSGESASFSSITIGGITISAGETPVTERTALVISDGGSNSYVPLLGEDTDVPTAMLDSVDDISANSIKVDCIRDYGHTSISGAVPVSCVYALPHSSNVSKALANSNEMSAGGTILTTRFRSFQKVNLGEVISLDNDTEDVFLVSGIYYTVTSNRINIRFNEAITSMVSEFWIEVNFTEVDNPEVTFSNNVVWAGGEPEWGILGGARMQIHILNGIASYVVVPPSQTTNN